MTEVMEKTAKTASYKHRLSADYFDLWRTELMKDLELKNVNQVPQLEKIVINVGISRAKDEKRLLDVVSNTLSKVSGQKPVTTVAKQSIASFKLREGSKIGVKLTLRGPRMYEFADRFINLVLPRLRDFHGVNPKSFDKQGNFSIGLPDQSVFPELAYEDIATSHGLQITFHIKSKSVEHSRALLEKLGMPFEKKGES